MNRSIGWVSRILIAFAILIAGTLYGSHIWAQQTTGGLGRQIQGNWVLVSLNNERDGKKFEGFGPNPRGSLILTPDGRFSIILLRANLPKFASNSREKGTEEENHAIVRGSIAYFGRYTVDEDGRTVNLLIDGATFPNWDGQNLKRTFTVEGDQLTYTTPASIGGTAVAVWKRAK